MSKGDSPSGHVQGKFGYRKNLIIRLCPLSCESPGTDFSKTFGRSLFQLGIPVISGFLGSSDLSSFPPTRCLEGKKNQDHEGRIWVVTLVWFLLSNCKVAFVPLWQGPSGVSRKNSHQVKTALSHSHVGTRDWAYMVKTDKIPQFQVASINSRCNSRCSGRLVWRAINRKWWWRIRRGTMWWVYIKSLSLLCAPCAHESFQLQPVMDEER